MYMYMYNEGSGSHACYTQPVPATVARVLSPLHATIMTQCGKARTREFNERNGNVRIRARE